VAAVHLREGLIAVPPRHSRDPRPRPPADDVLAPPDASLLDLLDRLLDKGVMANGDLTIGVAGVDLIYVRLAALLCAADQVLPRRPGTFARKRRHRGPRNSLGRR
jgi:hypothetical protein